jgi:hypothetical protein
MMPDRGFIMYYTKEDILTKPPHLTALIFYLFFNAAFTRSNKPRLNATVGLVSWIKTNQGEIKIMPQLVKGGKWVFGWVIVSSGMEIKIPPEAFTEYRFQPGEQVLFLRGSRRSGGFGIGRPKMLAQARLSLQPRFFGEGKVGENGQIMLPKESGIRPAERLLVVRGSNLALGFLQRGPIFEKSLKHTEIEIFVL